MFVSQAETDAAKTEIAALWARSRRALARLSMNPGDKQAVRDYAMASSELWQRGLFRYTGSTAKKS